jgi:hypothetical protein
MTTAATTTPDVQTVADVYFAAWEANDPERIVALHTEDTQFQIHTAGSEPVVGREHVREAFANVFAQFPGYGHEVHRLLLGPDHWVLDWTLHSDLGQLDCVDVVTLDATGLVQRKDTYVDPADLEAVFGGAA